MAKSIKYPKLVVGDFKNRDEFEMHCAWLPAHDEPWWPSHPTGFVEHAQHVTLWWAMVPMDIWFYEVGKPSELLAKIASIIDGGWPGTTPERISNLMHCVALANGWNNFEPPIQEELPARVRNYRRTTDAKERAKLTPTLRYKILERDNRTCQSCGATVASGAILHVDHIIPICQNGRTIEENLQALCSGCNAGKGAR